VLRKLKLRLDYSRTRLFIPKPSPPLQTRSKLYFSQFRVPLAVLYVIKCVHHTVPLSWRYDLKSLKKSDKIQQFKYLQHVLSQIKDKTFDSSGMTSILLPNLPSGPRYNDLWDEEFDDGATLLVGSITWYPVSNLALGIYLDPWRYIFGERQSFSTLWWFKPRRSSSLGLCARLFLIAHIARPGVRSRR